MDNKSLIPDKKQIGRKPVTCDNCVLHNSDDKCDEDLVFNSRECKKKKKGRGKGKPRRYTPKQLQKQIDLYFSTFDDTGTKISASGNPMVATMSGLAYFLGVDRLTLLAWTREPDNDYSNTAKKAVSKLCGYWESFLMSGKAPAGASFWLRNHGWAADLSKDKTEVTASDAAGKEMKVTIEVVRDVPFETEGDK